MGWPGATKMQFTRRGLAVAGALDNLCKEELGWLGSFGARVGRWRMKTAGPRPSLTN